MGRPTYVCAICSEHFTRKHSAKRHNFNIHAGRSEIVPFIEYMAGRSSGRYLASHPSWYRNQRQLQVNHRHQSELVVADTANSFRLQNLQRPLPLNAPSYSQTATDHQLQKLEELRLLLGKFCSTQNAHVILELAKFNLRQGDEGFLNDRLEQFRTLDGQAWRPV
jgi:hypothetical protein